MKIQLFQSSKFYTFNWSAAFGTCNIIIKLVSQSSRDFAINFLTQCLFSLHFFVMFCLNMLAASRTLRLSSGPVNRSPAGARLGRIEDIVFVATF